MTRQGCLLVTLFSACRWLWLVSFANINLHRNRKVCDHCGELNRWIQIFWGKGQGDCIFSISFIIEIYKVYHTSCMYLLIDDDDDWYIHTYNYPPLPAYHSSITFLSTPIPLPKFYFLFLLFASTKVMDH